MGWDAGSRSSLFKGGAAANSENWKALNAVARIELDRGKHQEALNAFRGVLLIRPDYSPALLGAGEAAMQLNHLPEAEKYLEAAGGPDAANQMGLVKVRQNRPAEAKKWFERAIEQQRDHSGAINNLGVLYMQLGQPNDAVAAFEFGIQQAPDDEQLYMNLGRVYVGLGQRRTGARYTAAAACPKTRQSGRCTRAGELEFTIK